MRLRGLPVKGKCQLDGKGYNIGVEKCRCRGVIMAMSPLIVEIDKKNNKEMKMEKEMSRE